MLHPFDNYRTKILLENQLYNVHRYYKSKEVKNYTMR